MAMTVDELQVLITAQTSKFNSEIAKVQSQISGLDKNVKNTSTNMTKSFGSLAAKVISVGAIIKATASSITRAMNYIEDENFFHYSSSFDWYNKSPTYTPLMLIAFKDNKAID